MRDVREDFGLLLAANGIRPARVVTSEGCRYAGRARERDGGDLPDHAAGIDLVTYPALDLLLSLQDAPDVDEIRDLISTWDCNDGSGPLLVISHFTNIEELTNFSVYDGEMVMIDPKRDNRVLGYVRLGWRAGCGAFRVKGCSAGRSINCSMR